MKFIKSKIDQLKICWNLKPVKRTKLNTNIIVDIYKNGRIEVVEIDRKF